MNLKRSARTGLATAVFGAVALCATAQPAQALAGTSSGNLATPDGTGQDIAACDGRSPSAGSALAPYHIDVTAQYPVTAMATPEEIGDLRDLSMVVTQTAMITAASVKVEFFTDPFDTVALLQNPRPARTLFGLVTPTSPTAAAVTFTNDSIDNTAFLRITATWQKTGGATEAFVCSLRTGGASI